MAYKLNYRKKFLFKDGENLKKNKRIALFIETSAKIRLIDDDFFAELSKKWFFQKKFEKWKLILFDQKKWWWKIWRIKIYYN